MAQHFCTILLDVSDWIGLIVAIVIGILSSLGSLRKKRGEMEQKEMKHHKERQEHFDSIRLAYDPYANPRPEKPQMPELPNPIIDSLPEEGQRVTSEEPMMETPNVEETERTPEQNYWRQAVIASEIFNRKY